MRGTATAQVTLLKYGLLAAYTANLGDDIQTLAALQFYPRVDVIIHREYLDKVDCEDDVKVVMNGWFMHRPEAWPPSSKILPHFTSMHITPSAAPMMLNSKGVEYFRRYEPIGARDKFTERLLRSSGIKSYFSGCLTLTLDYRFGCLRKHGDGPILLVDLPKHILHILRKRFRDERFVGITQNMLNRNPFANPIDRCLLKALNLVTRALRGVLRTERCVYVDLARRYWSFKMLRHCFKIQLLERLRLALERLYLLSNARCVITARLHIALPSIALNVPTIFIPASRGAMIRVSGLLKFMTYYTPEKFVKVLESCDIEKICQNAYPRNIDELLILKKELIKSVNHFLKRG